MVGITQEKQFISFISIADPKKKANLVTIRIKTDAKSLKKKDQLCCSYLKILT